MPEAATLDPPIDQVILDELVPPPRPRWRRAVYWVTFLAAFGAFIWAITTGTVIPKVSTGVQNLGGDRPVHLGVFVRNDSRVDIEVTSGPRARPGLSLLGYTTGPFTDDSDKPAETPRDPFPLRLRPGQLTDLTAWYRMTDCKAIRGIDPADDRIDLRVRIADGPASLITTERTIDAHDLGPSDSGTSSWPAAIAQHPCPG